MLLVSRYGNFPANYEIRRYIRPDSGDSMDRPKLKHALDDWLEE